LATISHDLKTSVFGISYLIGKAKEEVKNENKEELLLSLKYLQANSDTLYNMIGDIIDYTYIKENKLRINPISFNL